MPKMKLDEITIKPAFQNLCPPLSQNEFKQLGENIESDGLREPLVIWNSDKPILLDGHNRLKILKSSDVDQVDVMKLDFEEETQARQWIIKNQLGRRNMTPDKMRVLRGELYNELKGSVGRPKKETEKEKGKESASENGEVETFDAAEAVAAQTGVSPATVKRDAKFADHISKLSAPAKNAILNEEIVASAADVGRLCVLPKEKQNELVQKVKDSKDTANEKKLKDILPKPKKATTKHKRAQVDDNDFEVPESMLEAFEARNDFVAFHRDGEKLVARAEALADGPANKHIKASDVSNLKTIVESIYNARPSIVNQDTKRSWIPASEVEEV